MTTLETLKAIRSTLATPDKWTQGEFNRDVSGLPVNDGGDVPVCFCLAGAALENARNGDYYGAMEALALQVRLRGFDTILLFNDHHGTDHPKILSVIDAAIAAEGAGQ
jgi:hypothetical protein